MRNLRTHGSPPFQVAVIHGGPGAGGEMAPVARELARRRGVLEPIQTSDTLAGQIEELRAVVLSRGVAPVTLVGYSWGAWLSLLTAAKYPSVVGKAILVSCGPLLEADAERIHRTRMERLSEDQRAEYLGLIAATRALTAAQLERLGALASKADAFDPIEAPPAEAEGIAVRPEVYRKVWEAAVGLRRSGRLLGLIGRVRCPVVALHGDHDPHPADGVRNPLSRALKDFRFVLIQECGHTPWLERRARSGFYTALQEELA
jgi:pimeloyl-ACP methyl ester carboxylesterase